VNLFTRFLSQSLPDGDLRQFIAHWDALESLIIHTYKTKQVTAADEAEYGQIRQWFGRNYAHFQSALTPLWQATQIGGAPAQQDPFQRLTSAKKLTAFRDDWAAMQALPAAREALNRLIMQRQEKG
jgi:hypothetical protein